MKKLTNQPWKTIAPSIARHRAKNAHIRKRNQNKSPRRVEAFKAMPIRLTGDSKVSSLPLEIRGAVVDAIRSPLLTLLKLLIKLRQAN